MARKEKTLTIKSGRDEGKTFLITEMPLLKADNWSMRAIFALTKAGVMVDGLDATNGIMEMTKAATSVLSGLNTEDGIEMLNELLGCAKIVTSTGMVREVQWEDEVEDLSTLLKIRKEALLLHIGFLTQGNSQDSSN